MFSLKAVYRGGCGAWLALKASGVFPKSRLQGRGVGLGFTIHGTSQSFPLWAGRACFINGGLFSSPTNVGHHNPSPFGTSILASTLSFLRSMWDRPQIHPPLGYNPSPFGTSVLADTLSFLQSMWDRSQIHLLLGPASLLARRLVSTPLRGTARRLTHRPVSGSNTICNDPDPPLADIVLFGLSLLKRVY